jgi:GNAT superfamily N-acetyltransferase
MGERLLKQPDLEIPDDVRTTIEKWLSITNPQFKDYGFVTVDETGYKPTIAGWATVDFVAKGAGDLGFFTMPDYRRKGLGTIAAAAALEYGFQLGLTRVNWTCDANNQASIHTAERLGLDRIEDYTMAMLVMDEAGHFGNLGYFALQAKDFDLAVRSFDKALALEPESPTYIYYEASQSAAMAGNPHKALEYLTQAVNRGWVDAVHARECQAFACLHDFPEWETLLNRMRKG